MSEFDKVLKIGQLLDELSVAFVKKNPRLRKGSREMMAYTYLGSAIENVAAYAARAHPDLMKSCAEMGGPDVWKAAAALAMADFPEAKAEAKWRLELSKSRARASAAR